MAGRRIVVVVLLSCFAHQLRRLSWAKASNARSCEFSESRAVKATTRDSRRCQQPARRRRRRPRRRAGSSRCRRTPSGSYCRLTLAHDIAAVAPTCHALLTLWLASGLPFR